MTKQTQLPPTNAPESSERTTADLAPSKRIFAPPAPPTEPAPLYQQHHHPPRRRGNTLLWMVLAVIGAQLFAPEAYKPTRFAGEAASDFYGELMNESNRKELELLQQQEIARRLAELQTEYANWKGNCMLVAMLDQQLGALCYQAAENYYREALAQIRKSQVHIPSGSS